MRTVLMGVSKRTGEAGRSRTIGSRRIVHCSVTEHPTSEWTLQQFRELLAFDHPYRTLLHDRDSIFATAVGRGCRANVGIRSNEQIVVATQLDGSKWEDLRTERRKDQGDGAVFEEVYPIDDFVAYGTILLRLHTDGKSWKGPAGGACTASRPPGAF